MLFRMLFVVSFLIGFSQFSNHLFSQSTRTQPSCPFQLIIALDFSGSEWEFVSEIQTALHALTDEFELQEHKLKLGIITFNRGAELVLPLTGETEKMDSVIQSLSIPYMVRATDIHAAIALADQEFRKFNLENVPKYFVLISDGDPHAHQRDYGFQKDLENMERLKAGNPDKRIDPVHTISLYTGPMSPFPNSWREKMPDKLLLVT